MSKSVTTEQQRQEQKRQKKEAEYRAAIRPLPAWSRVAAGLIVAVLLLFFIAWGHIYNTDIPGVEVSANGFAYAAAGITRDFMSTGAIYQDIAVPFYYYAGAWVESLATYTLLALIAVVLAIALQVMALLKPNKLFSCGAALLDCAAGVLLIVCFFTAVSMRRSDILPIYCSGNPACSIRSYAIVPGILALCAAIANAYAGVKYAQAEKLLK